MLFHGTPGRSLNFWWSVQIRSGSIKTTKYLKGRMTLPYSDCLKSQRRSSATDQMKVDRLGFKLASVSQCIATLAQPVAAPLPRDLRVESCLAEPFNGLSNIEPIAMHTTPPFTKRSVEPRIFQSHMTHVSTFLNSTQMSVFEASSQPFNKSLLIKQPT